MKAILASAGLFLCLAACSSNTSTTAQEEPSIMQDTTGTESEWVSLFDGKTTEGWHTYGRETIGTAWKVQDGVLYLDASDKKDWQTNAGGDIVTEEAYDDFHLKLDWKISEGGNSGIIFYVQEDTSQYQYPWQTGLEMQILDDARHPDGKIIKHRSADLYDLVTASPEATKPVGEWNQAEIISQDGKLDFIMNGQKVVSTTLWDDNWRQMIANSKFKDMPGFGSFKRGKIALQDHGDNVWFRNIQIKRL